MPTSRRFRRTAVLVISACLVVPGAAGMAASDDPAPQRASHSPQPKVAASADLGAYYFARQEPLASTQYVGVDGKTYGRSPILIRGRDNHVFFGEEFDSACGHGKAYGKAMKRYSALASLLRRSGKRVIFTVSPNKSAVLKSKLLPSQLPHKKCDLLGMSQQERLIDRFGAKGYVPIRQALVDRAKRTGHVYWPLDTHWTRVGADVWVDAMARTLDPRLADRQRFRKGKETIEVDVSYLEVIPKTRETGPALYTSTPVRVAPVPGSLPYDPDKQFSTQHAWTTTPARKAWKGDTVILGDSFTYRALDNMQPLFARGTFLWYNQLSLDVLVDALVDADTVVMQITQRYVPISPLVLPAFKRQVEQALS
jgi:alginate O-acetyltransferase complex protein AlgJ